jgi:hypothetical protein
VPCPRGSEIGVSGLKASWAARRYSPGRFIL